jgi:excisionase family DNA binding protein
MRGDVVLTVAEAAKHATVSEALVRIWIREGTLPHFRLGRKGKRGSIRIAVEDLDGLLANFRVEKREPERLKAPVRKPSVLHHIRIS